MTEKRMKQIAADAKSWAKEAYPKSTDVLVSFSFGDCILDICTPAAESLSPNQWERVVYYYEDED